MFHLFRHFLAVEEAGTFTEAARRVHLTQPALSTSIRKLEEELEARLFHRGRTGATLTAAGEALVPRARMALSAVEEGRRAVQEVTGLRAGQVRLGAGPTACTYLLPGVLSAYREAHPAVKFFLQEAHAHEVWNALGAGELDLGLVSDVSVPSTEGWWAVEPWIHDELVVVRGPASGGHGWVSFPRGSALRGLLEAGFDSPEVVMELRSIAAIKGNVRAGVGRALISKAAIARDLADGSLTIVAQEGPWMRRTLMLVHAGVHRLPPAAARLRQMLLSAPGSCT